MTVELELEEQEVLDNLNDVVECAAELMTVASLSDKDLRTNLEGLLLATLALAEICEERRSSFEHDELQHESEHYQLTLKRIWVPKSFSH